MFLILKLKSLWKKEEREQMFGIKSRNRTNFIKNFRTFFLIVHDFY